MGISEKLVLTIRDEWGKFSSPSFTAAGSVLQVVLLEPFGQPVLQVVYSLVDREALLGVMAYLPVEDGDIRQFLEGFFYDLLFEPSDMSRGMLVDGVWWWSQGSVPPSQPLTGGIVLVEQGTWRG